MALTRMRSAVAAAAVVALLTACGSSDGGGSGGQPVPVADQPVAQFGNGPKDAKVTYQPDVVVVDGGPKAIRSAGSDGLTWTVDGNAQGVGDLQPGKIMLATSRAAGRVVKVEGAGADRVVTLAPVQLSEVIRDGEIEADGPLSTDGLTYQEIPDAPGAVSVPESTQGGADPSATENPSATNEPTEPAEPSTETSETPDGFVVRTPPLRLRTGGTPMPPPTLGALEKTIGDWVVKPFLDKNGLMTNVGLDVGVTPTQGLKLKLGLKLRIENLQRSMRLGFHDGQITQNSKFMIDGLKLMSLSVAAGSANGTSDNKKVKIEVPIELNQQVIAGGFPFVISQKFTFLVTTGLSEKNANMTALGSWTFSGPLGFDGTNVVVPTVTEKDDMLKSLQGVSIGINGIVAAFQYRIMIGMGVPAAAAGPYAKVIVSAGLTNGSDAGMVKCKNVSLTLSAGAGVGTTLNKTVASAIEKVLGRAIGKKDDFPLVTKDLLKYSKSDPDIRGCQV
ncbi:hypothetical protein [Actinocrispum wychmicini]|uniref:Uncharacterized protein n=1 Tax=Actinocrispum wychmicini TaxID=1213861 RepID=A0A4R2IJY8_9PSEU|nr:hypothetical protein [Actinocrispum wychmicini]TCO44702.1 hypothetical protein EV192_12323 [Actinocrispum wychmicini]